MEHLKFVARARMFGQIEIRNIFYLEVATFPTQAELLTDVPAYLSGFYTPLLGSLSTVFNLYGWDVHKWNATTHKWEFAIEGSVNLTGTNGAEPLPTQMAGVMVAYTLTKRVFARKFIAGLVVGATVGNILISTTLLALTNALTFWLSDFTAPSAKVYSPVTLTKSFTFVTFSQAIVDKIMGTMRRRKAGVGI